MQALGEPHLEGGLTCGDKSLRLFVELLDHPHCEDRRWPASASGLPAPALGVAACEAYFRLALARPSHQNEQGQRRRKRQPMSPHLLHPLRKLEALPSKSSKVGDPL